MTLKKPDSNYQYWNDESDNKLAELSKTHSYAVIAEMMNRTKNSIERRHHMLVDKGVIARRSKYENVLEINHRNDILVKQPPKYTRFLKMISDKTCVCSDPHSPSVDINLVISMCNVCKTQGITDCALLGDIFDNVMFSVYPDAFGKSKDDVTKQRTVSSRLFDILLSTFKRLYLIAGNHDFRFFKYTKGLGDFQDLVDQINKQEYLGRITMSSAPIMYINSNWMGVHPNSKITDFVQEGRGMACKYQKDVLMAHCHRMGNVSEPSGKYLAVGTGGLLDPERTSYYMNSPSKTSRWEPGFVLLKGRVHEEFRENRPEKIDMWKEKQIW